MLSNPALVELASGQSHDRSATVQQIHVPLHRSKKKKKKIIKRKENKNKTKDTHTCTHERRKEALCEVHQSQDGE